MRDFSSIIKDKGIPWVRHWIQASHEWSKNFIDENGVVDYEALGREEFEFREALYNKDFSRNKRAEYLWTEALKTHERQLANGSKGGRPRKNSPDTRGGSASPAGCAAGKRIPPSTAELYDFAEAARLSEADAREWWELCTERGWKDRSGKPIRDWKAACERYCARRAINRMAKGET